MMRALNVGRKSFSDEGWDRLCFAASLRDAICVWKLPRKCSGILLLSVKGTCIESDQVSAAVACSNKPSLS